MRNNFVGLFTYKSLGIHPDIPKNNIGKQETDEDNSDIIFLKQGCNGCPSRMYGAGIARLTSIVLKIKFQVI